MSVTLLSPSVHVKAVSKMEQAIDEIGFTGYHAKLFCLNGFGYASPAKMTSVLVPLFIDTYEIPFVSDMPRIRC